MCDTSNLVRGTCVTLATLCNLVAIVCEIISFGAEQPNLRAVDACVDACGCNVVTVAPEGS